MHTNVPGKPEAGIDEPAGHDIWRRCHEILALPRSRSPRLKPARINPQGDPAPRCGHHRQAEAPPERPHHRPETGRLSALLPARSGSPQLPALRPRAEVPDRLPQPRRRAGRRPRSSSGPSRTSRAAGCAACRGCGRPRTGRRPGRPRPGAVDQSGRGGQRSCRSGRRFSGGRLAVVEPGVAVSPARGRTGSRRGGGRWGGRGAS